MNVKQLSEKTRAAILHYAIALKAVSGRDLILNAGFDEVFDDDAETISVRMDNKIEEIAVELLEAPEPEISDIGNKLVNFPSFVDLGQAEQQIAKVAAEITSTLGEIWHVDGVWHQGLSHSSSCHRPCCISPLPTVGGNRSASPIQCGEPSAS